jgi:hypothetical protein
MLTQDWPAYVGWRSVTTVRGIRMRECANNYNVHLKVGQGACAILYDCQYRQNPQREIAGPIRVIVHHNNPYSQPGFESDLWFHSLDFRPLNQPSKTQYIDFKFFFFLPLSH